jgi:hypothetical protein
LGFLIRVTKPFLIFIVKVVVRTKKYCKYHGTLTEGRLCTVDLLIRVDRLVIKYVMFSISKTADIN